MHRISVLLAVVVIALGSFSITHAQTFDYGPASSQYCPNLTLDLQRGDRDATRQGQVTELQMFLVDYYDLEPSAYISGYFGRLTHVNVVRFQREHGLPAVGRVGPLTRAAIASTCGIQANNLPITIPTATTNQTTQSCAFNGQSIVHGSSVNAYALSSVVYGQSCEAVRETRTCLNGVLSGSFPHATCSVRAAVETTNTSCTFNGQTVAHGASVTAYSASMVPSGQLCSSVAGQHTCNNGSFNDVFVYASCSVSQENMASCSFNNQTIAHGDSVAAYQSASVISPNQCVSEQRTCNNGTLSGSYGSAACTVTSPTVSVNMKSCNVYNASGLARTVPHGTIASDPSVFVGSEITGITTALAPYHQCRNGAWFLREGMMSGGRTIIPAFDVCELTTASAYYFGLYHLLGPLCGPSVKGNIVSLRVGLDPSDGGAPLTVRIAVASYGQATSIQTPALPYTVSWGDGSVENFPAVYLDGTYMVPHNQSHTYAQPGTYTVTVQNSMETKVKTVIVR